MKWSDNKETILKGVRNVCFLSIFLLNTLIFCNYIYKIIRTEGKLMQHKHSNQSHFLFAIAG